MRGPRQPDPGTQPGCYRCSLPGLTGFTAGCRGGTDADHRYFTSLGWPQAIQARRRLSGRRFLSYAAGPCSFGATRTFRRDGRVVEGARLESVYTPKRRIEGSNPSLSATIYLKRRKAIMLFVFHPDVSLRN